MKDSSQLEGYVIYSLAAKTGKGAALKVRLIQMSDDDRGTWEVTGSADGWTIEPFNKNTKTQLFIANKDGAIDVPLMFTFKKGAVSIEITKSGVNSEKWFSWVTN